MPTLLSARDAAPKLGLTEYGLKRLARQRKVPFIKLGARTLRFNLAEVEAALLKRVVKAL